MATRVLVLGAGFGGLELTTRLSERLGDAVRITLVDQSDSFVFGFSKLDVMFGGRELAEVRLPYRDLAAPGVEFCQERVVSIDPERRSVVTDRATHEADILVVALGADLDPAATPGLVEGGHEFYSPEGAERTRDALARFESGDVVVSVLGPFFKCPPAPNETALLLHDYLTRRGIRNRCTIHLVTPMPMPIPISQDTSAAIVDLLVERDVRYRPASRVTGYDQASKVLQLGDGSTVPCDLLLGIPVHCAPPVVVESGLTDDGWIAVDTATFATRFPDVYAIGDVTSAPVPRAGSIAEGEAATLADVLIARLGAGTPPEPYQGGAICYIETGGGTVARVDVNFLSGATPTALFTAPSVDIAAEKRMFADVRRARWFGR
ncbi:MAG: NAD(P)/FAD-dependent oxidoreductase [Jatrophihabitantaceae bacterium]